MCADPGSEGRKDAIPKLIDDDIQHRSQLVSLLPGGCPISHASLLSDQERTAFPAGESFDKGGVEAPIREDANAKNSPSRGQQIDHGIAEGGGRSSSAFE